MIKNFLPVFSLATVPAWEAFHNSFKKVIDFSILIFEFIIAQPILILFVAGSIIPIGLGIIRIMKGTVD